MNTHALVRAMVWGLAVGGSGALFGTRALAGETWADALFQEHAHDFGAVPRGAVVRHPFVLTNRYAESLSIVDVRASCGCTSGRASASVVPPGGQAVIEARMDTRNFVGEKATTLTVTLLTASGRQGEARLAVRSNILSDIVLNPGTLDFGAVNRGQTPRQVLTVDRIGQPGWKVERMVATTRLSQFIDAQIVPVASPRGQSYRLTVSIRPDAPSGAVREEIRILTNDPESPVIPVLVRAEVRGALAASPSLLSLGRASSASGVSGRFLVRGNQPFSISRIEGAGDGFQVKADDAGARKPLHIVTVTFQPSETDTRGDLRRTFQVFTDLPGEPPLELNAAVSAE